MTAKNHTKPISTDERKTAMTTDAATKIKPTAHPNTFTPMSFRRLFELWIPLFVDIWLVGVSLFAILYMPPYWLGLLCGGFFPAALLTVIFFHPVEGNVFYVSVILFVSVLGASIAAALYSQNWLNVPLALLVSLPSHLSVIAYQWSNKKF